MADSPDMSNADDSEHEIHVPSNGSQHPENLPRDYAGYRLLEVIGQGGTGIVYRAYKIGDKDQSIVALKKPHPNGILDPRMRALIEREGAKTSKLKHDHILSAIAWSSGASEPYLVTPYMSKGTLLNQLKVQDGENSKQIPISTIVKWCIQLADALSYLHHFDTNIFHRDIKPENIFVDENDDVRMADFGLYRSEHHDTLLEEHSDKQIGTPRYMAPELFKGWPHDKISDIYGLGATLYTALTGIVPYADIKDSDTLKATVRDGGDLVPIKTLRPDAPVKLLQIINQCMAYDRDHRFPSAVSLHKAFQAFEKKATVSVLGISLNALVHYERKANNPTADFLSRVAKVFNVSIDELLNHEVSHERKPGPPSRLEQLTEKLAALPRQKQKAVIEILEGYLKTAVS